MPTNTHRKKLFAVAILLTFTALLFGAFVFLFVVHIDKYDTDDIFANVYNKNKSLLIQNRSSSGDTVSAATLDSERLLIAPNGENVYTESTSTFENGPESDSCGFSYSPVISKGTTLSYTYFSKDGNYYSKGITKDEDGNIVDYYLNANNKSYNYKGGSYAAISDNGIFMPLAATDTGAAESTLDETTSIGQLNALPVEDENTSTNDTSVSVTDMFGPDSDVLGTETINGKEYYILVWSYQSYCPGSEDEKIITKSWADKDNFSIIKQEEYLGSIDASNLIQSVSSTYTQSNPEFSEISSVFDFDLSVEVKDYTWTPSTDSTDPEYLNAWRTLFTSNSIYFLKSLDISSSSIYSSHLDLPQSYDYLEDRNFYPAGSLGNDLYAYYSETIKPSAGSSLYSIYGGGDSTTYTFMNIDVYSSENDLDTAYGDSLKTPVKSTTVSINEESITADVFDQSLLTNSSSSYSGKEGESVPAASPIIDIDPETGERPEDVINPTKFYYLKFNYQGKFYVVQLTVSEDNTTLLDNLRFEGFNPATNWESIEAIIKELPRSY